MGKIIQMEVPEGIDENLIREVVEALVTLKELNKKLESLGFLKIQEESLGKFLEEEPELYTQEDIKEKV